MNDKLVDYLGRKADKILRLTMIEACRAELCGSVSILQKKDETFSSLSLPLSLSLYLFVRDGILSVADYNSTWVGVVVVVVVFVKYFLSLADFPPGTMG